MILRRIHSSLQDRAPQSVFGQNHWYIALRAMMDGDEFHRPTSVMNDFQFLDITQDLDASNRSENILAGGPPTTISNNEGLVLRQVEEVIRTASSVTTANDTHTRPGTDDKVFFFPVLFPILFIRRCKVVRLEGVEFCVS